MQVRYDSFDVSYRNAKQPSVVTVRFEAASLRVIFGAHAKKGTSSRRGDFQPVVPYIDLVASTRSIISTSQIRVCPKG